MVHIDGSAANKPHIASSIDTKPHLDGDTHGSHFRIPWSNKGRQGDPGGPGPQGPRGGDTGEAPNPTTMFGTPTVWDDFSGADGTINATFAPTGHKYTHGGDATHLMRTSNRYTPTPTPGDADILYLTHSSKVDWVFAKFVLTPGTGTGGQNAVVGTCNVGFGQGSVQLAIYEGTHGGPLGVDWQLFYVPSPIVDPYPVITSGTWSGGFTLDRTGATIYWFGMRRLSTNTVALYLPDGSVHVTTDTNIGTYWGKRVGIQSRRPNSTDGHSEFTFVGTGGDTGSVGSGSTPPLPAVIHFTGDSTTGVTTPDPGTALNADIDVSFALIPDSLTPGASQSFGGQYGSAGDRSWRVLLTTASLIQFNYYYDGTTSNTVSSSVALSSAATAIRVTRQSSTGDVKFYTSTDPAGTNEASVTWTQLGSTRSTTAGDLFNSGDSLKVALSGTSGFTGKAYWAVFKNGIAGTIVAQVDFRHLWAAGTTYTGTAGNVWTLEGSGYEWLLDRSVIANPVLPGNVTLSGTPTSGQVITASSGTAASWVTPSGGGSAPLFVRKTADEAVTSSTTLQNDDHLFLALAASTYYTFQAFIDYDGATTGDFKMGFTVPAGATINWFSVGGGSAMSSDTAVTQMNIRPRKDATANTYGALTTGDNLHVVGYVLTAGTSGNLQMQWAQGTSDATATNVRTHSWMEAQARA